MPYKFSCQGSMQVTQLKAAESSSSLNYSQLLMQAQQEHQKPFRSIQHFKSHLNQVGM